MRLANAWPLAALICALTLPSIAQAASAEILRDRYGVPHIYAKTEPALLHALLERVTRTTIDDNQAIIGAFEFQA